VGVDQVLFQLLQVSHGLLKEPSGKNRIKKNADGVAGWDVMMRAAF
jgi:hypothetical protein